MRSTMINRKLLAVVLTLAVIAVLIVPMGTAFAAGPWGVTGAANSGGGTISPFGTTNVPDGGNITFTITPDGGGAVTHVWDNGVDKGAITTYTITNVTAKHTVVAAFSPYPAYTLQLVGATTTTLTQAQVEAIVAASPAPTYTDADGNWTGVALYRLIALVDDGDPATFNSELASVYSVKMTGADAYSKIIAPAEYGNFTFASSETVIVANKLNSSQLPFVTSSGKIVYPLKVTGSGCGQSSYKAGGLVKIELLNLPVSSVSVSPTSQAVANGETFTVSLDVYTNTATRGFQGNVSFDASKLIANSVTEGTFLSDWTTANGGEVVKAGTTAINNTAGTIGTPGWAIMGGNTSSGATGSGTLCTISFTAKTGIDDLASITPTYAKLADVTSIRIPGTTYEGGTVAIGNVAMPDLAVSALSATKVDDTTYTITYTITNQGNAAAAASTTSIVIDAGTPITVACPGLAASASDTVTTGNQTLTSGSDTIVVTADSAGVVSESVESNNSRTIVYATAGDAGDTVINGNIAAKLVLTAPPAIDPWNLIQGPNSVSGPANVKCNSDWQLQVHDQNATAGHMTKWMLSSGYDLSTKLTDALNVSCQSSKVLSATPQTIATGTPAGQSLDSGQDLTVGFDQYVYYADPVLTGGYSYHIVITITASVTI